MKIDEKIWVISDASGYGVGALYGQGQDWQTCQPTSFMSKKFTSAERSYQTFEHEALTIIEALMKWEDKLVRCKFNIMRLWKPSKQVIVMVNPDASSVGTNIYLVLNTR